MEIGPVDKDNPPPKSNIESPESAPGQVTGNKDDRNKIDISEEARKLQAGTIEDKGPSGTESAHSEKLRAIRRRIESGFYVRPDIMEKTAERLLEKEEFKEITPDAIIESNSNDTEDINAVDVSDNDKTMDDHQFPEQTIP